MKKLRFTPREDRLFRRHYGRLPTARLAAMLGRKPHCLHAYARYHGIRSRRTWSLRERATVRALYGEMSPAEIAVKLGRTVAYVKKIAQQIGVAGTLKPWTDEQVEILKTEYGITPAAQLVERLGHSKRVIYSKAHCLGLSANRRHRLPAEALELLWHLRDEPEAVDYFANSLGLKRGEVDRSLKIMLARGGV